MHDSLTATRWGTDSLLKRLGRSQPERIDLVSDQQLAERAAANDGAAFGELYKRYVADVFKYVKLRVGDERLAEDLTQDVFMNAFRAMPGFVWQGHFRPWLLRSAHNRVANHWRSHYRTPRQLDLTEIEMDGDHDLALASDDDLAETVGSAAELHAILAALPALTELQREVIALRFGAELSVAETAEWMGRSESAVKNLQFSALSALRTRLRAKRDC